MDREKIENLFDKYVKKLRITPTWDVKLEFFNALEQTVEELAKCFLLEFGENKEFSYGRCKGMKSYNELFDGLKNIE